MNERMDIVREFNWFPKYYFTHFIFLNRQLLFFSHSHFRDAAHRYISFAISLYSVRRNTIYRLLSFCLSRIRQSHTYHRYKLIIFFNQKLIVSSISLISVKEIYIYIYHFHSQLILISLHIVGSISLQFSLNKQWACLDLPQKSVDRFKLEFCCTF